MNYYNEHDQKTAAWLRELISRGFIPAGTVDERSIVDVQADELREFTQCHFFAGIGGWSLALQLAGWPAERPVWTGSCPCQPFSAAGKGLAQADERHLWPVFFDLIRECRPECVFGEQVASAIGHGWLDGISADLEAEGYACGAAVLGAHSVRSPHQRQRLYWVANDRSGRREMANLHNGSSFAPGSEWTPSFLGVCGTPDRLDDARRQSDERRGESGDVGRPPDQKQGEARQRQWCRNADCDSVQDDCGGLPIAGSERRERREGAEEGRLNNGPDARWEQGNGSAASICEAGAWSDCQLVHCRDGKTRRIPTEPAFFPLAHGVPARVVRLRGYGNAIVPQVAAEFIAAYYDCASIR